MARALRFQYPGALYHVMARGDGGKVVFQTDDDRLVFLKRLDWIATRLQMGHPGSVSRLVCGVKRDRKLEKRVNELEKLLQ